jgi:ABC-type dipeptide/oligopeptide/nickel transport system permease subunit
MEFSNPKAKIDSSKFVFVQRDEKIFDKKFDTKPVGYLRDALTRFGKNKTNVVATTILFTLILMSIFIPTFTSKNFTATEVRMRFLPPKVPILERFGFFDGTVQIQAQQVVLSTVDPATGLGVPNPARYPTEHIVEGTLTNFQLGCTDKVESCAGGDVRFSNRTDNRVTTFGSNSSFFLNLAANPTIQIEATEFRGSENTSLDVLLRNVNEPDYVVIGQIQETGVHTFSVSDVLGSGSGLPFSTNIQLRFSNELNADFAQISGVVVTDDNAGDTPIFESSGFDLSTFATVEGSGRTTRHGAEVTMASFKFDAYGAALGNYVISSFSQSNYLDIVERYGDTCTRIENPDNPNGWFMSEGCPVVEVLSESEPIVINGEEFRSYTLVMNYRLLREYDENLFFIAGTTDAGRDLFSLTWIALRTSLLIGVAAAVVNIIIGVVYGAVSGYYGGKIDIIMERFSEVIARIPFLVVLAISVAYIGPGITTLFIVLIVSGWIGIASVTRTQFYRFKGREYVLASRTLGAKDTRLIFRHILPNGIGTIITASVLSIPLVIFTESTLSYLGFGIGHGQQFNIGPINFSGVSIGVLLADGRTEIVDKPYLTIFPAIIISILMITFNMFGNALRDAFNPTLRGSN